MSIDLARVIRPGDGIVVAQACAEPQTLTEALVAQREAFSGATLFLGVNYSGIVKPQHADHLRLTSYCGAGHNRALADAGGNPRTKPDRDHRANGHQHARANRDGHGDSDA